MSPYDEMVSIAELIADEAEGIYTPLELYAQIFCRLRLKNVERVIADLPPELRAAFVAWARENYDNDYDPSEFTAIGGEGVLETPDEAFAAIRAWFAARRGP